MNIADMIQSYFGGSADILGQKAGLDTSTAQRVLSNGLPLQLEALAQHAAKPEGKTQINDAISNLPDFGSVKEALSEADGANNLMRAGELLSPVLMGGQAEGIIGKVAGLAGAQTSGVQKMMNMVLPLLLSQLGKLGIDFGNLGSMLGNLGSLNLGGAAAAGAGAVASVAGKLAGAAANTTKDIADTAKGAADTAGQAASKATDAVSDTAKDVTASADKAVGDATSAAKEAASDAKDAAADKAKGATDAAGKALGAVAGAAGVAAGTAGLGAVLNPSNLVDLMKAQFSGDNAEKIGAAAGFTGKDAGRAAQGAMPVVLNALLEKGKTAAGAEEVLNMSRQFDNLSDENGQLNTKLLGDSAEMSRLEGQGKGLLGKLFGNIDEITGRLGTVLGGSGANAGRLMALTTPLVLSVLGNRARASNMNGSALSGIFGTLSGKMGSLLPAGLGGIAGLLGAKAAAGAAKAKASAAAGTAKAAATVPTATAAKSSTPKPSTPPVPPAPPSTVVTEKKGGGFPWWLLAIPLLLLGIYAFTQCNKPATGGTGEVGSCPTTIVVEDPKSDGDLPVVAFTMSGKAPANTEISIKAADEEVATATAGKDCAWSTEMPAPEAGEQTYSVEGGDGDLKSEFKANFAEGADSAEGAEGSAGDDAASGDADFTIVEPAAQAQLAGAFTMSGTGKAGDEIELFEDETSLGKVTVGEDGNWSFEVESPTVGDRTYSLKTPEGEMIGNVAATVAKAEGASEDDAASGDDAADTEGTDAEGSADSDSSDADAADENAEGAEGDDAASEDDSAAFSIVEPADQAQLDAGAFTMSGTGKPGDEIELFEDETSLGKVTVGEDGKWSFDVPSPEAGDHTYSLQTPGGKRVGNVAATVAKPKADADAKTCDKEYSLSITDGQTVNEPFRFGGMGKGEGYSVTVKRGERTIGTKDVKLDATCGWSYNSKPGAGTITYEVRPMGEADTDPLSTVNLTVEKSKTK